MKISIIIRAYNAEATLPRAIESALQQDFQRDQYEVIVIDDGSTDATASVAQSIHDSRINIVRQNNRGITEAANAGIAAARADVVLFLDADDELMPGSIFALCATLDETSADYAYGEYFEEYKGTRKLVQPDTPFEAPIGAFAWRRKKLVSEEGFGRDTIFPEYDILLRTWGRWKGARVSVPIFVYKRSATSLTGDASRIRDSIRLLTDNYPERFVEISRIRSYEL